MARYQEYCPQGRTNKVIEFKIKDARKPSPTISCICGTESGIGGRKVREVVEALGDVAASFGAHGEAGSLRNLAEGIKPTPKPHSSAIRRVG